MPEAIEFLKAHDLRDRVVEIIENAQEFVVLVTAYVGSWAHLEHAIRTTIARGASVCLVMRTPDGGRRSRDKTRREADHFMAMGVRVCCVEGLHAKVYLNEREAIVSSFNLNARRENIELGMLVRDAAQVADCLNKIRSYCPELSTEKHAKAGPNTSSPHLEHSGESAGFCIGCAGRIPFDARRPMCSSCYRSSTRGRNLAVTPHRSCHLCGRADLATLSKPICGECWQQLDSEEQWRISAALA